GQIPLADRDEVYLLLRYTYERRGEMAGLHPEGEPTACGRLDVGDGQRVYWETRGDPAKPAAVVLHGGPGSGASPAFARLFDPARHRIVLFDQRQCGRSTPNAGSFETDLTANTTEHLLGDLERLRAHLGIARWTVYGASRRSTR